MRNVLRRPSPAMVVALLALFIALGGVGYAATQIDGKNLVGRSVGHKKIKANTLTGAEILESSLGKVPKAVHSTVADRVGGLRVRRFDYAPRAPAGSTTLFTLEGLTLTASNDETDGFKVVATTAATAANPATIITGALNEAGNNDTDNLNANKAFHSGQTFDIINTTTGTQVTDPAADLQIGHTNYRAPNGAVVTIEWSSDFITGGANFFGTAIAG
ncbi:MAG: hypothetical protein QOH38_1165 [Thermoleophilaceae bacterium]|nr:hypothetical protein [Thermoleophilaceae bacterium]